MSTGRKRTINIPVGRGKRKKSRGSRGDTKEEKSDRYPFSELNTILERNQGKREQVLAGISESDENFVIAVQTSLHFDTGVSSLKQISPRAGEIPDRENVPQLPMVSGIPTMSVIQYRENILREESGTSKVERELRSQLKRTRDGLSESRQHALDMSAISDANEHSELGPEDAGYESVQELEVGSTEVTEAIQQSDSAEIDKGRTTDGIPIPPEEAGDIKPAIIASPLPKRTMISRLIQLVKRIFHRKSKDPVDETSSVLSPSVDDSEEKDEPVLFAHERSLQPIHLREIRTKLNDSKSVIDGCTSLISEEFNITHRKASSLQDYVATPFYLVHAMSHDSFIEWMGHSAQQKAELSEECEGHISGLSARPRDSLLLRDLVRSLGQGDVPEAEFIELHDMIVEVKGPRLRAILLANLFSRTEMIHEDWWIAKHIRADQQEILEKQMKFLRLKFNPEQISGAMEILCGAALVNPKLIAKVHNIHRRTASQRYEQKVEEWVVENIPEVNFLTEKEIRSGKIRSYGGLRLFRRVTPDLLFEEPVMLESEEVPIRWIDAKNATYDPAFTSPELMAGLFDQMEKYVDKYGCGLVVWGKQFSEEWNEATRPNVVHSFLEN